MDLNKLELAWAAGFFDGEGNATGPGPRESRGNRAVLGVSLTQIDDEVLHRFRAAVGGLGHVRGPKGPYGEGRKPVYTWRTHRFEHAQAIIAMLWPFLSSIKRKQCAGALLGAVANYRRQSRYQEYCKKGHKLADTRIVRNRGRTTARGGDTQCGVCYRKYQREWQEACRAEAKLGATPW